LIPFVGARATAIALLAHEVATVIERADMLSQLTDMASTDALTGLPNRRAWETSLEQALAEDQRVALAMLDLDHFKDFNDTYGHPAVDRLLRETAAAWREELRAGDLVARLGGDEFALLLPDCNAANALEVVERLRLRIPGKETCSAGIASHEPGARPDALMARADTALYEAKTAGRNRTCLTSNRLRSLTRPRADQRATRKKASTASTRRWSSSQTGRSSLAKMLVMCFSTAPGVTTRLSAIAVFERPSAISSSTERSRAVSELSAFSDPWWGASSSVTTSRSSTVPPAATRRSASRNARTSPIRSFRRYPIPALFSPISSLA
jgi:diguanylate cyclase (GGDEF)-like protein